MEPTRPSARLLLIGATAALMVAAGASRAAACGRDAPPAWPGSRTLLEPRVWGLDAPPILLPRTPGQAPLPPCHGLSCSGPVHEPLASGQPPILDRADHALGFGTRPRPTHVARNIAWMSSSASYEPPALDQPFRPPTV